MKKLLFLAMLASSFVVLLKGSSPRGNNTINYASSASQCDSSSSDECLKSVEE